jgi:hypothetical protein
MKQLSYELTVANMLTDPMVQTVMAADHVDPKELARMLTSVAKALRPTPPALCGACAS